MPVFQIVMLAIIQGITEFLPISSSAHLILPSEILGWQAQGLAFDVALHIGSLVAVMWYFRKDMTDITIDWFSAFAKKEQTSAQKANVSMGWAVIIGTIPAVIIGLVLNDVIDTVIRAPSVIIFVIAATTLTFGVLLWWSEKQGEKLVALQQQGKREKPELNVITAVKIGFAQAVALIPGTSRSGITMTAALALGFDKAMAAKFSFYLSIPLILAAGALKTLELIQQAEPVAWMDLGLGSVLSFASAYACIYLFLKWIDRIGFLPFVIYRLILGAVLLVIGFMVV